jgi:hypothetical protein
MSAYTLEQLRQIAPPEYRSLDPEDLVREYARINRIPFEQAADYYGVKPRGTLGEMRRQAAGGAMVDLPRMVGQGLKATGIAPQYGQELVEGAEERAYQYDPDPRAERGLVGQAGVLGARALAPMAPALAAAFVPGGQAVAPAVAAGLFGTSAYQDTYEKLIEQGISEEDARAAALRTGMIQGPAEGIATAVGLRAIRPVAAAVRGVPTTARVAGAMTDTGVLKPFAKGMAINLAVQPATEVAQDVGTELVERAYGAAPEDLGEIAKQSALGGAGLTVLLGPLAIGGSVQRSRNAQRLREAMENPDVDPAFRAQAMDVIMAEARRQGVGAQDIDAWFDARLQEEDARTEELRQMEEQRRQDALLAPVNLLGEQAQELEGLQTSPFSSLEQQRRFEEQLQNRDMGAGTLEEQRAAALAPVEAAGQQFQDLLGERAAGQLSAMEPGQRWREIQAQREQAAAAATDAGQQWQELRVAQLRQQMSEQDAIEQAGREWQALQPDVLQRQSALRTPSGRRVTQRTSPVAPTGQLDMSLPQAPASTMLPTPPAQTSALPATEGGPSSLLTDRPVTTLSPSPVADAGVSPAAPVAAGVFSTTPGTDGTQTSQAQQTEAQRPAAAAVQPAAAGQPAAGDAGAAVEAPRVARTEAPVAPANVSEAIKEDNELSRLLTAVEAENDKADSEAAKADKLFAAITGDKKKPPGRPSLPAQVYAAIRNALLNPKAAIMVRKKGSVQKDAAATKQYGERIEGIVAALNEFSAAYEAYTSQNLVRSNEVIKRGEEAGEKVAPRAAALKEKAAAVRAALAKVGDAVGGNAKDVEAIVRFVKDRAQKERAGDPKVEKVDIKLSRAWTAAKRESFMQEADLLDVSGEPVRQSREAAAKGAASQLVIAATEGYAVFGKGAKQDGLSGVLNYIRTIGTPYEKLLAQAIKKAIEGKAPIKIKFVTEGTSQYDPKTNTITINETSSKEVALHEALHGALQWYVYSNPKAPQVVALRTALQRVVDYKGELPPKAAEVQAVLRRTLAGKSKTADLDAVLELISYGNTLNDFRRALQGIESDAPRTFTKFANDVMEAIAALVRRLLGGRQTLATDVLDNTFQLLEAARATPQEKAPRAGNVLRADVQSVPPTADTKPSDVTRTLAGNTSTDTLAKAANYPDARTYRATPAASFNLTRQLFERIGFSQTGASTQKVRDAFTKAGQVVRENFPRLEQSILKLNTNFGMAPGIVQLKEYFKSHQNTGIQEMEKLSEAMHRNPKLATPILNYLDGDAKAFDGIKDASALKAIADNVRYHLETYIDSLPQGSKERALFQGLKFTEYMLHPQSVAQMANKSFGLSTLPRLLKLETRTEATLDAFATLLPTKDGVVDSEAVLYQTFEAIPGKDGTISRVPLGFISKELAETSPPAGLDIDRNRLWKFNGRDGAGYKFVSRPVTGADVRKMAAERKVEQVSAALLNTMAALSHNYAGRNFMRGLYGFGRGANNAPTAQSVVFDSIEQINKTFKGRTITKDNILVDNGEESRMNAVKDRARRTGTWVRLPEGPKYGDMAGKLVHGPVWSTMIDMHDREPLFNAQALNTTMRWFKKAKTIYSPATHVNNVLTNYSLLLLHGIEHRTLRDAAKMFYMFEVSPDKMGAKDRALVQAFYRSGAVLGQYTQTEAKENIAKALMDNITPTPGGSFITKINDLLKAEKKKAEMLQNAARAGRNVDSRAMEIYAAEDNIFRFAAFLHTAGNLQARDGTAALTDQQLTEAGIAARKMFLDYDIDARWVRAARQSFLPFVSWSYAILPVMGRLAIERPWAMVNMIGAVALMGAAFDGDDEFWREQGPEMVRERAWWGAGPHMFMRVPFMGTDEDPVFYNIGKSIPMMALFDPPMGDTRLFGQSWVPGALTPGGPYSNLIAAMFFGIDPFTGKKLADVSDSDLNKLMKVGEAVYGTMAPSWGQPRFAGNITDLLESKSGPLGKEPNALFLARTLGGMSLYEFNRGETQFFNDLEVKKIKREFGALMNTAKREEYAKGYPNYEALDAELADLREKLEKRIAEIRGEE